MDRYVLDTSALIALREDEPGSDEVEDVLRKAQAKKVKIFVSFMSFMEMYYCSLRANGKAHALRTFVEMKMLPMERVDVSDELLFLAGDIKGSATLSLADSWIAATAVMHKATLVHKDPEFEQLSTKLPLKSLPYKKS